MNPIYQQSYSKLRLDAVQRNSIQHNNYAVDNLAQNSNTNQYELKEILADNSHPSAPRFTYVLRDRSYREGSTVKLNCEIIGYPRPKIMWRFSANGVSTGILLNLF